jgi:hypothetical protein
MDAMADHIKQLESHKDLEASVIKKTKVHKVLKAIIKLDSIPKEDEYQFKKRSSDLLNTWNRALAADVEVTTAKPAAEPATTTNGVKHDEEKDVKPADAPDSAKPAEADVPTTDAGDEKGSAAVVETETSAEHAAEAAPTTTAV